MSDAADEPQKAASQKPELRKISDEELRQILKKHKGWVAAEDKTGLEHLRADLSWADLRGQRAYLIRAQLQGANLEGAQLQGGKLEGTQLQGACLDKAQLQEADLRGAQLQGAYLYGAHLREADLTGANFERVTEDGEPGQERSADLTNADFRDADLSNAQLKTVNGLRAEMLAGAVLTNAKLPDDVAKFDKLTHVAETSRNASTVFFGLLAASLYSWLTIATTTDVALITGTASSPLPIINTDIALSGFYLAAPLILIAVYFYFHLYLQRLWGDLASLPAVFPDGEALDGKAYPWLLNGLVRAHFKKLELAQRPLTFVENAVSIFLAWWVVPFTLLAFWLDFLPRHDWLGTLLHVVLIAGAAWFGVYSYQRAVQTLRGGATATEEEKRSLGARRQALGHGRGDQPLRVRIWHTIRRYLPGGMEAACAGFAIVLVLSAGAWIDPGDDLLTRLGSTLGYETDADLTEDDVSTKPSGWTGLEQSTDEEIAQVKGGDLEGVDLRSADASGAFLIKAKLKGTDLRRADLSGADLRNAYLSKADLRGAILGNAYLSGADLRNADLSGGAFLREAYLSGANLSFATLIDAELSGADLSGADLISATLVDANLRDANLSGADLRADLRGADLRGANLFGTDLRGADLRGANFRDTVLSGANLHSAVLTLANFSGADLTDARGVTPQQLEKACGNYHTNLSKPLSIGLCVRPAR